MEQFKNGLSQQGTPRLLALALTLLGGVVVGLIQFRQGIVHLLDTVTYWSGAEAVRNGNLFDSNLAPSFSNFTAIEFLDRGGQLPFVDFPIGYPLVAGFFGIFIGVRHAMELLCVLALMAISAAFIYGSKNSATAKAQPFIIGILGVLITMMPTTRLVTQGALSEPLFCAVALWLVICLARYRSGGHWTMVAVLTIAAGLLRFIGAPLALLSGWERYKRTQQKLSSALWSLALMLPAALNILLATGAGGGHNAGWRGLGRQDMDVFVRSIGGWFDAKQGDLRRTYFTAEGPSWWSWVIALMWLALVIFAVAHLIQRSKRLPATAEIALVASGIISLGLIAGMMGFDALVIADNRLMLPTGVLTLAALSWIISDQVQERGRALFIPAALLLVIFTICAVRPWNVGESFSESSGLKPYSQAALDSGAVVIISNDADAVHWDTGLPTAYAPLPMQALTGQAQDIAPLYANLPCALWRAKGAVVLSDGVTFSGADIDLLNEQVDAGRLTLTSSNGASVYLPTARACDE